MIPVLFKEDEQIFTHNGIGALYESLSCEVIEEENGAFTMELEYPVDGEWFSELKDFRIIQAKPNDIDDPHNFRIYEIEKSIDELTVFVRANTRTNDFGNNLITSYFGRNVTPQQAMNGMKNKLIEPTNFDLISDIQTRSNVDWIRINPLNAIVGVKGSLVDIFGGQIKRTNTAIYLYSRRGKDNVVTIRPGKNLDGLKMTVSTAGLVTKILPTFTYRPVNVPDYHMVTLKKDGTQEKRRVQNSGDTTLRDDITIIGDVVSSQYVDNYPTNYWSSVDYSSDDELKSKVDEYIDTRLTHAREAPEIVDMSGFEDDLEKFVKTELDKRSKQYFTDDNPGVDKPTVRMTVNMFQLADSPDWEKFKDLERIGLTDTLDVWVEEYDIDVEVRVTSLTYDSIGELVRGFNAGSDRASRQSAIEKKYDDLTNATNNYITSFKNGVQNIMRNTADGLNRKFEGYTEPPAEISSEGDIWFREMGGGVTEIWIHDGVYWQPLLTEDFGKKIEADVEAVQSELEEAKLQAVADSEKALADAKAHAEAEDARIRGELESEVGGALEIAEQAKADAVAKANQALIEAKAHAEAEDSRIRAELESDIGGAIALADQAKAHAVTKANQALVDAKAHADAEIVLIETHFDDIIEGVESDVAVAKQTADTALYKINNDIADKFTSLDAEVLSIETISNSAQTNAQTALNQSLEALGDASTALSNAQTALNRADTAIGNISDINVEIDEINSSLSLKANTTTVNDLTGRVNTAETSITANADAIKLKANTTTVNTLTGRVSTAETSIKANADAIKLKASTSSVNTLTGRVSTAESSITANATAISQRLTKTEVNTLVDGKGYAKEASVATRFNDIQSTVDGTTQTIATLRKDVNGKATITQYNTLKSTVDGTVTRVGNAEGKITTIETNVSGLQTTVASKASQSQVTQLATGLSSVVTDLENLEIGGTNLLLNSDMRKTDSGSISPFKFSLSNSEWNDLQGKEITLSVHVTKTNVDSTVTQERIGAEFSITYDDGTRDFIGAWHTKYDPKTYSGRVSRTYRVRNREITTVNSVGIYIQVGGSNLSVSRPKVEIGNKATDWTPAPEDVQSKITQNANNINLRVEKGNVLSQINIEAERTLIQSNKLVLDARSVIFTGSAFIPSAQIASLDAAKITTGTIAAARLDATAIVTAGLTANVIKSTHIETSTATIDKIFATDIMVNRLAAKTAFINRVKAIDIDAARITSGTINAARLNAIEIVASGLTTDVIKSYHIASSAATIDKLFANEVLIDKLTSKTAFINNIKAVEIDAGKITSGTINAARLNAKEIMAQGLTADVITATHINANTAMYDKLFSTSQATNRLSARSAWIKTANLVNLSVTNAKIADATIASAKIVSLDVSKISGNTGEFVRLALQSVYASMNLTGNGLSVQGNKWQLWMNHFGIGIINEQGVSMGGFRSMADNVTNEPTTVALAVERGYTGTMSFRNTSGSWDRAIAVDGSSGNITMHRPVTFDGIAYMGRVVMPDEFALELGPQGQIVSRGADLNRSTYERHQFYTTRAGSRRGLSVQWDQLMIGRTLNMDGNAITNQSDIRLKENIEPSNLNALREIERLEFIDFEWKKDMTVNKNKPDGRHFGIKAQYAPFLQTKLESEDSYLSIDMSKQVNLNSKATQELLEYTRSLEKRIEELEGAM